MKRRISKVVNFLAFNLLFFALYLNFIHKDKSVQSTSHSIQSAASNGTVLVENPEQYLQKESQHSSVKSDNNTTQKENSDALKLSFN